MTLFNHHPAGRKSSPFTLIELLAALAVFSIMMVLLMRFTNVANTAWTQSAANMRVYQNARAVLDVISQDVEGIVLSNILGSEVEIVDTGGDITFVTATGDDDAYASKLIEVTYQLTDETLERREVGDSDGTDWDFLGAPSGWETNSTGSFEEVCTGVAVFSLDVLPNTTSPQYIRVSITLVDDQAKVDIFKNQSKRTFTKTMVINQ